MQPDLESEFLKIVENDEWLITKLRAVQSLGLKNGAIAAGVVRSAVWDKLHIFEAKTQCGDVDVIFFDEYNIDGAFERSMEQRLGALDPSVRWEVVNQATVHHYTKEPPYSSLEHAMTRWAETATAIAVYIDSNDQIRYIAPHGLEDLMSMTVRPHLVTPDSRSVYLDRIANKGWKQKWPKITMLVPE